MAQRGRPKAQLDYGLIERLAMIQCTQEEIASAVGVSVRTLQRDEEFCRIYKKGIDHGRMSLRRKQWEAVENGNTGMMVWLGKQYLGQREKHDTEVSGKDGGAISVSDARGALLAKLAQEGPQATNGSPNRDQ